ncbi:MAG: class I SAM-dependent methyltransferase [Bacteroidota bacterium]
MSKNDPLGQAILAYAENGDETEIVVESDLMENDVIPVPYLFRSREFMPEQERVAIERAEGSILDVGAGAGVHTSILRDRGHHVTAIDTSRGAITYLNDTFPGKDHRCMDVREFNEERFDTIILLMNGIGIAGTLDKLPAFIDHLMSLLKPGGKLLFDSTDVSYFYEEDDGGMWIDLNSSYFGEFRFRMEYKDHKTDWFNWLYVDAGTLEETIKAMNLSLKIIYTKEESYLAEITHQL